MRHYVRKATKLFDNICSNDKNIFQLEKSFRLVMPSAHISTNKFCFRKSFELLNDVNARFLSTVKFLITFTFVN